MQNAFAFFGRHAGILLALGIAAGIVVPPQAAIAAPLLLPSIVLLLGLSLDIDVLTFMARLAAIIGGSLVLALAIRAVAPGAAIARRREMLDGMAVLGLMALALSIMQVAGFLAFGWMGRPRALVAALVSGNRNIGMLLGALGPQADFDIVLYLALGQIPVFLTPLCGPLNRWASSRRVSGGNAEV